jgi:hypothetical protein
VAAPARDVRWGGAKFIGTASYGLWAQDELPDGEEGPVPSAAGAGGAIERVSEGAGGEAVMWVTRGTTLGNPFVMRGESERNAVVAAYAELLKTGGTVWGVARRYAVSGRVLSVDPAQSRVKMHSRLEALRRLAQRVRQGERIRIRCRCGLAARCHGDVIVDWVEKHV